MSEYQYYEFLAIDRPLDKAAQETMRGLSSRAQVTAVSFTNTYNYGDFRGNPGALMEQWFDLHLYLANWGSRRLMMRLPERLIDRRIVDACQCDPDRATLRAVGEHLILDIQRGELDTDRDEGPGWLTALAPLRADLLSGDYRLFYLAWLMEVEFETIRPEAPEPLPGIGPLNGPLESFASFFCLDPDLVQAAAERDSVPGRAALAPDAAHQVIASLTDKEKIAFLSRLFEGDPHAAAELRATVSRLLNAGRETSKAVPRTAGELRARAAELRVEREQQTARQAARQRDQEVLDAARQRQERLVAIARRGEGVWRDVEAEIERSNVASYDRAMGLLLDLRAVAGERDTLPEFTRRIGEIRERHARKARFLQRIVELV